MENESNDLKQKMPEEDINPNLQFQNGDLVDQGESSNSRSTNEEVNILSTNVELPLDPSSSGSDIHSTVIVCPTSTRSHIDPAGILSTDANASRSENPMVCEDCRTSFMAMFQSEDLSNDCGSGTGFPGFVAELTRCMHNFPQGAEQQGMEAQVEDVILAQAAVVLSDSNSDNSDEELDIDYAGLTEDTICEQLRSYVHAQTNMSEANTDHKSCCICLQGFHNGDLLGVLDCGHDYHYECIKRWLSEKNRCPLCKIRGLFV